jgi:hypothetical protein
MTKKSRNGILLVSVCVSLMWAACTQERQPCLEPKLVSLNLGVYKTQIDTGGNVIITDSVLPYGTLYALDTNRITETYAAPSSKFPFYLSPVSNECTWLIAPDTLSAGDTLRFYYTRKLTFLSNACGYTYYYNIDSVRKGANSRIDSLILANSNVTNNVNIEHVKIFFH